MSIAALSCSSQLGASFGRSAAGIAHQMDDHCVFVSEVARYKLALQQHGPRLADDDNYMLKSASSTSTTTSSCLVAPSLSAQPSSGAVESHQQQRPRSASLSLVSRLSSPRHHPVRSHPPTPPPSSSNTRANNAAAAAAKVATTSATAATNLSSPYCRLLCACLPTCCCDCNLLSSIAECQAVYHQACARYIATNETAGCCTSSVSSITNDPAINDASPPQTVPQDVVSLFFSTFLNNKNFITLRILC